MTTAHPEHRWKITGIIQPNGRKRVYGRPVFVDHRDEIGMNQCYEIVRVDGAPVEPDIWKELARRCPRCRLPKTTVVDQRKVA